MKKVLIGVGALAVIGGIGFYFYNKNKKESEGLASSTTDADKSVAPPMDTDSKVAPALSPKVPLSKKETRKEGRVDKKTFKADCGKRPVLKKKRATWQACVDSAKSSSFNGSEEFDAFDVSKLDF